jgi:Ca2+-binding EF-hand superfamily protein
MYKYTTVLLAAVLSASAMAGEAMTKTAVITSFESLDKNRDQQISRTEASADKRLSNTFATTDTDGDGYVSKAEFMARPQS